MGLQGTYGWQADARHTSNALGGTILVGFPTSEYFAPEINLFGLQADRDYSAGHDNEYGGGLDFAIYPMQRSSAFSPFLLLGGGAQYEDRAANDHTYGFANAGGGFLINLNEAHTVAKIGRAPSELQSLMRISYAVFCLKKKNKNTTTNTYHN